MLRQLEGVTKLRLVILDACRNNPFPAATRGVRGLGRIEPDLGTLVAFAAKDGTLAQDGKGRHSPFTAALLKRIATPGLDVRRVFGYVSEDVMLATGRRQEPYLYGRLGGDEVYLAPQAPADLYPKPSVPQPPSEAARAWAAAKDSTSIAVLEAFRRQYGAKSPVYNELAKERIDGLRAVETGKDCALFWKPDPNGPSSQPKWGTPEWADCMLYSGKGGNVEALEREVAKVQKEWKQQDWTRFCKARGDCGDRSGEPHIFRSRR